MDFTDADIAKKLGGKAISTTKTLSETSEVLGGLKTANNGLNQTEKIIDGINGIINKIFVGVEKLRDQQIKQEPPQREPRLILNEPALEGRIKDFMNMLSGDDKKKVEEGFEEKKAVIMPLLKETIKDVVRIG